MLNICVTLKTLSLSYVNIEPFPSGGPKMTCKGISNIHVTLKRVSKPFRCMSRSMPNSLLKSLHAIST